MMAACGGSIRFAGHDERFARRGGRAGLLHAPVYDNGPLPLKATLAESPMATPDSTMPPDRPSSNSKE
jgi:hypothetical protein